MKVVLLALFVASITAAPIQPKPTRAQVLQAANQLRSVYAKKHGIANMNELVYDEKLEHLAKSELEKHGKCPETPVIHRGNLEIYSNKKHDNAILDDMISDPGRTKIAFVENSCDGNPYTVVMDTDPKVRMISGEPGSICPKDHKFKHNGLCGVHRGYERKATTLFKVWKCSLGSVFVVFAKHDIERYC